jgi:hypothetical protein
MLARGVNKRRFGGTAEAVPFHEALPNLFASPVAGGKRGARSGVRKDDLAARLNEAAPSPKAAELSLGLDGSETRPYTTVTGPSLYGQACGRGERPMCVGVQLASETGRDRPLDCAGSFASEWFSAFS